MQMGNYAQLAFVFPAATVVGWLIGVGLDKWLHTTWIYIVGLLLGIVAGFVELIRTVSKNSFSIPLCVSQSLCGLRCRRDRAWSAKALSHPSPVMARARSLRPLVRTLAFG